jgi:hypothetical protein
MEGISRIRKALQEGNDFAFLSSLCYEIKDIRIQIDEIANNSRSETLPVYIDERYISRPESSDLSVQLTYTNDFINALSKSKFVIIIFNKINDKIRNYDHGSVLSGTSVSFWEVELFHAAILQKPIYVIVEKDFENQSRPFLRQLLDILKLSAIKIYQED